MKFLMDANLSYKLTISLKDKGYDVIHTDDLPDKERTKDNEIRNISIKEDRIIITKDSDWNSCKITSCHDWKYCKQSSYPVI